jgi:hypothetical protein
MNYDVMLSKSISQDISATKSLDELDKIVYIRIHIRLCTSIQVSTHEIYRYHYAVYRSNELSKC